MYVNVRDARPCAIPSFVETVRGILHNGLQIFSYKVQVVRQFFPNGFGTTIAFCKHFSAIVHLRGVVNKRNYRFRASERPSLLHKTPLRSAQVQFNILGLKTI